MSNINTSNWKEFKLETLFEKVPVEKINGKAGDFPTEPTGDYVIPLLTAGVDNQGLARYAKREQCPTILKNVLSVSANGANTGVTYFQDIEFAVLQDAYALKLKDGTIENKEVGLFLAASINKVLHGNFDWSNKAGWNNIKHLSILLPATTEDVPDWVYMEEYIETLSTRVQEHIAGLNTVASTEKDNGVLSSVRTFDEFRMEDVFEIYSPKKRFNANAVVFGGEHPYVARGASNNGIRGYINEDTQYLSPAKTLSFGQDTATVFYQERAYFTGDKIKVLKLKGHELTPCIAAWLITIITKAFSVFTWGTSSFDEKIIKAIKIKLPLKPNTTDEIDYDYMEQYMAALQQRVKQTLDTLEPVAKM